MSLTQVYYVASTARSKLGREANRADHNLRRLVGHANTLDNLMTTLSEAEQEQERWFNESVKKASNKSDEPKHITWVDSIPEEDESDGEESDSDDDSDTYDEDADMFDIPLRKIRSPPVTVSSAELDDEEYDEMDEEYDDEHALTRVASKFEHSPPELMNDSDSDSEDESMPSSPEQETAEFSEKDRQSIATTSFYDSKAQQGLEDYIIQQAQQPQAPLIAAY